MEQKRKNLPNTVDYGLDTVGRYIAQSTIPFFRPVLPTAGLSAHGTVTVIDGIISV